MILNKDNIILFLILAVCAATFLLYIPSLFSIDDIGYYLMGKSFSDDLSFKVWTGFEEYKTTAFGIFQPVYPLNGDSLYVKYPPFYAFISAPFYKMFHLQGLFILNILSFAGTIYFLYLFSLYLFDNRKIAERVVIVYVFSTFAVEYAIGLWPHILSVLLIVSGNYFILKYLKSDNAYLFHLLTGSAILSIATGVRLQNIVFFGLALAAVIFIKRDSKAVLLSLLAGLPFIVFQGVINKSRFGSFDPFSYGHYKGKNLGYYLQYPEYFVLVGLFVFLFFLMVRKRKLSLKIKYSIISLSALVLITGIFSNKVLSGIFYYWLYTFYCNLVDLTVFYNTKDLIKGESGALLFGGIVKKSILQSCPYLLLSFLTPVFMFRGKIEKNISVFLTALFIVPLAFISFFFFHGGYAFNVRYAMELLPFAVILFCWLIRDIVFKWKEILIAAILSSVLPFIFYYQKGAGLNTERFILYFPLFIAFLLLILFIIRGIKNEFTGEKNPAFLNIVILVALFYSFSAGWTGDLVSSRRVRLNNLYSYSSLSKIIKDDSLVVMLEDISVEIAPLKESGKIRLAYIPFDKVDSYLEMIDFYLSRSIPVYFVATKQNEKEVSAEFLEYFSVREKKNEKFLIFEIEKRKAKVVESQTEKKEI